MLARAEIREAGNLAAVVISAPDATVRLSRCGFHHAGAADVVFQTLNLAHSIATGEVLFPRSQFVTAKGDISADYAYPAFN